MSKSVTTSVEYKNIIFRVLAAFAAALFLVKYGERISIFKALLMPSFYMAIIGSFIIAFFLIYIVHYVTVGLDKKTGWQEYPLKRVLLQFVLGFLVPSIMAYLLAAIYFMLYGINIVHTDYDIFDYPVTVMMLFGLNAYYYLYAYIYRLKTAKVRDKSSEILQPGIAPAPQIQKEYILVHVNNEEISLNVVEEICYFYCLNDVYFVKTFDNKTYDIEMTLIEIEAKYAGRYFFRINRHTVVNFNAIHSFSNEKKERFTLVHLKSGLFTGKLEEEIRQFTVSREKLNAFKSWMDR